MVRYRTAFLNFCRYFKRNTQIRYLTDLDPNLQQCLDLDPHSAKNLDPDTDILYIKGKQIRNITESRSGIPILIQKQILLLIK
jgi:hypothetical protein